MSGIKLALSVINAVFGDKDSLCNDFDDDFDNDFDNDLDNDFDDIVDYDFDDDIDNDLINNDQETDDISFTGNYSPDEKASMAREADRQFNEYKHQDAMGRINSNHGNDQSAAFSYKYAQEAYKKYTDLKSKLK